MQYQAEWQSNSSIVSGLSISYRAAPTVFNMGGTVYLIFGAYSHDFTGYNWTGSAWQSDTNIVSGLSTAGTTYCTPTVFNMSGVWYLITGERYGTFRGFNWTGSAWQSDTNIVSGLSTTANHITPTVFEISGTWYLIIGKEDGTFSGFKRVGAAWQSYSNIVSGLGDLGGYSAPSVCTIGDTLYLIAGASDDEFHGFDWTGSAWQSNTNIVDGLHWSGNQPIPAVFGMGNRTYYTISGEFGTHIGGWLYRIPAATTWTAASVGGVATFNLTGYNISSQTLLGTFSITAGTLDWLRLANLTDGDLYSLFYTGGDRIETQETSAGSIIFSTNLPIGEYTISRTITLNETGVHGFVYEGTTETNEPIPSVIVTIYNTTWSDSVVTDGSGYYIFTDLTNDTYVLKFTKDRYITVDFQYVTPTINETYRKDIWMQRDTGQFYSRHYVTFCVLNIWGTRHPGVDAVCYIDGNIDSTGTTGGDGTVTLSLFEDVEYTLTFTNATQGISETLTLYPRDDYYYIIIGDTSTWTETEHAICEEIHITVAKRIIDDTHVWINVTYLDNIDGTTELDAYINETNLDDPANETPIAHHAFTGNLNDTSHNFTVPMTGGQAYFVRLHATHTEFGDNWHTYTVRRMGMLLDLGLPSGIYIYICIMLVLFVGAMFGGTTSTTGAISISILGWLFLAFGWLQPALGIFAAVSVSAASVYAVSVAIIHRHRKAGYA